MQYIAGGARWEHGAAKSRRRLTTAQKRTTMEPEKGGGYSMFDAQQSLLSKVITAIKVFFERLMEKLGK